MPYIDLGLMPFLGRAAGGGLRFGTPETFPAGAVIPNGLWFAVAPSGTIGTMMIDGTAVPVTGGMFPSNGDLTVTASPDITLVRLSGVAMQGAKGDKGDPGTPGSPGAPGPAASWGSITGTLASQTDLNTALNAKQNTLVSGTNIRTVNGNSLVGAGDVAVAGGAATWGSIGGTIANQTDLQSAFNAKQNTLVSGTNIRTVNGNSLVGAGDVAVSAGAVSWGSITGTLASQTDLNTALNGKQATLVGSGAGQNIKTVGGANMLGTGDVPVASSWGSITGTLSAQTDLNTALNGKQATLVGTGAGQNIKTVNNNNVLGTGNIAVQAELVSGTNIKTVNNTTLLGAGDVPVAARAGDLTGTATSTTVIALQGRAVSQLPNPAEDDVLTWQSATWRAAAPTGGGPGPGLSAPLITSATGAMSREEGTSFSYTLTATGNPAPTLSVVSGLPAGLTFTSPTISGTLPAYPSGPHNIQLRAQNSEGTDNQTLVLTITQAATLTAPVVTAGQSISGTEGTAISTYQIQTTGGTPTSYAVSGTALPAGLTLNTTTGEITGTPAAGSASGSPYTRQITATNAAGTSPAVNITITIAAATGGTSSNIYFQPSGVQPPGPHEHGQMMVQSNGTLWVWYDGVLGVDEWLSA